MPLNFWPIVVFLYSTRMHEGSRGSRFQDRGKEPSLWSSDLTSLTSAASCRGQESSFHQLLYSPGFAGAKGFHCKALRSLEHRIQDKQILETQDLVSPAFSENEKKNTRPVKIADVNAHAFDQKDFWKMLHKGVHDFTTYYRHHHKWWRVPVVESFLRIVICLVFSPFIQHNNRNLTVSWKVLRVLKASGAVFWYVEGLRMWISKSILERKQTVRRS